MKQIRKISNILLLLLSAYMIFDGLMVFIGTSGRVSGSEFGMLIAIANQLSLIMLWLATFAIRSFLPESEKA
ncbi:MAG: hypothetical protein ACPG3V_07780 [Porticoccaceae bacterium]